MRFGAKLKLVGSRTRPITIVFYPIECLRIIQIQRKFRGVDDDIAHDHILIIQRNNLFV